MSCLNIWGVIHYISWTEGFCNWEFKTERIRYNRIGKSYFVFA